MPRFYFKKLVRDKIVDDCLRDPKVIKTKWHELNNKEYRQELIKKVTEEANEIPLTDEDPSVVLSEIADLQTVIDALRLSAGFSEKEVRKQVEVKALKKGVFAQKHYIEYVDLAEDSEWVAVFRAQPDKYQEQA